MRTVRSGFGYAQVWQKTQTWKGEPLYSRQLVSALFWTFGVALAGLLAALALGPAGLLTAPIIWLVQLARLTRRGGFAWGWPMLAGKLAAMSGLLRYRLTRLAGRKTGDRKSIL